ncbi:hypothetical protein [Nocardia sp. NPDC127526]|uniref:hypothetical protein n=1 Tax=Nocardia sp. NPDC127526 TaxID=3345393 RepID=UPI00363CD8BC
MPDISGSVARSARELWPDFIRPVAGVFAAVSLVVAGLVVFPGHPPPAPVGNSRVSFPVVTKPLPRESPSATVSVSGPATPPK